MPWICLVRSANARGGAGPGSTRRSPSPRPPAPATCPWTRSGGTDRDRRTGRRQAATTCRRPSATPPRRGTGPPGGYWYHRQRQAPAAQARDLAFQDQLMDRLAALTGVALHVGHQPGAAGLRSRGRHRLSGGREPSSGHAAWSGAGTCASSHGPLPRTPPLRRHPERTHETSRRRCHLETVGPGAEDRWDFWMPSTLNRPYGRYSPGRRLIHFVRTAVVHARSTGGVLSGQRAAIRSRLSGLAASAPGRTARGSPGRH